MMNKFKFAIVLFGLVFAVSCGERKEPISNLGEVTSDERNEILVLANKIGRASELMIVTDVMKYLAKDVVIKKDYESSFPTFNYDSYRKYISQAFPLLSNYQYIRSNETFERAENKKDIILRMSLNEKYIFQNKRLDETHRESWWVRKVDNKYEVYQILIQN